MRTLILNFKNYREILGEGSVALAKAAARAGEEAGVDVIVAPPAPFIGLVASRVKVKVYSQSVGTSGGEKSTGEMLPEAVKAAGASGTILNHSERRVSLGDIKALVPKLNESGLDLCLCASSSAEAGALSGFSPRYLAIEPPELIGTGVAVSKARPEVVRGTVQTTRKAGYRGAVLCGAGIVSGDDVKAAIGLGADGILVSSSVVKSDDWDSKLGELARSLI